jgi:hypothetical protein
MYMLLPDAARLFGRIHAEAFSIEPEVIFGEWLIGSH